VVQPNDNYWAISQKLYGTGAYFKALAHHNRAKIPNEHDLQLGDVVMAPDASDLHKAYPDLCPKPAHREAARRRSLAGGTQTPIGLGRVYMVQEGDNLFDIARHELGKATRWTEIVDLNREVLGASLEDLNYLTPGMKLILPQDRSAGELTRRPGSLYQR
jgi:nucleoid-associated protein YgaU